MHNGVFTSAPRDLIKERVRKGEIRVLKGGASDGAGWGEVLPKSIGSSTRDPDLLLLRTACG